MARLQNAEKGRLVKKIAVWTAVFVFLGGGVFAMVKLASNSDSSPSSVSLAAMISDNDRFLGNKDANVKIIEYSDFQCPACRYYHPILKKINEEFKEDIAFAYRHFPLSQHQNAKLAAYAAEAAGKQNKFWEMSDLIFENQDKWSKASSANAKEYFIGYASVLDLNAEQFKNDIFSESVKDKVESDLKSGLESFINATPTIFVNGKKIENPRDYDEFKKIIEEALGWR